LCAFGGTPSDPWRWTRVQRHELETQILCNPAGFVCRVICKWGTCVVASGSVPRQGATRLVFNDSRLKEVALFLEVDHLAHPGEGVFLVGEQGLQANLGGPAVGDVAQIPFEHGRIHAQHPSWHGVFGVAVFQLNGFVEQGLDLFLELIGPQVGVFELELIDQVNAKVAMHGLVAQDVLVLLGSAGHLVLAAQSQNLCETNVEEQAFHEASKHNE